MNNRRPRDNERKDLVPFTGKVSVPKRRNFIADFKALTKTFDEQVQLFTEFSCKWQQQRRRRVDLFHEGDDVETARDLWTRTREGAEQCVTDLQRQWAATKNLGDIYHPSLEYMMLRIAAMVRSRPDAKLSEAEKYAEQLALRLEAEDLSMMVLESVFREIEDELKKPPTFADVLPLVKMYKPRWQRRLAAIDLDLIRQMGEALEFKHAVFKDAVLEYLDTRGYVDLAAWVRENDWASAVWRVAIEATSRVEGLSELADKMEAGIAFIDGSFEAAKRILSKKKHVTLEWDLLLKNAQRRLNHDKQFVCDECAVGYEKRLMYCMVCGDGSTLADHELWEQQIEREQEELQAALQRERQAMQEQEQWWMRKDLQWKLQGKEEEARLRALFAPFWAQWRKELEQIK